MKKVLLFVFATILLASCVKEANFEGNIGRQVTFVGSFDDDDATKTILADGNAVNWNSNDPISIFDGTRIVRSNAVTEGDADSPTASFSATLATEGPWYAIYPYDETATISGDVVTTKVLKETTAKTNTFAKKVNVSIACSTPDNKMVFKNTMSYLKFKVSQENIYSVTLKANGGEQITGTVQIDYNDGEPVTTVVSDGSSTSTLLPSTGKATLGTTYFCYIGFVPTTFASGFTLIIKDVYGDTYEVAHDAAFTAERSKIYNVGIIDSEIVIDDAIVFEDADVERDIVAAFGGGIAAGKIYKSEAAAVSFEDFQAFSFTNPSAVNKFNELRYFTGLYADPVPGETRTGYCVPDAFFQGFTSLEEITLPSNITEVRPMTFSGCTALKSIEIPPLVTGIYKQSFDGCTSLTSVVLPEGLKSVTTKAFQNCSSITELVLPSTLTKVGDYGFYGLLAARRVVLSENITSLGIQAFWRLQSAESVGPEGTPAGHLVVPAKYPKVTEFCFCDEYYLHTLTIQNGPTSIDRRAFRKFGTKVASGTPIKGTIPASVTAIADLAFESSDFDYLVFEGTTPPTISGAPFSNAVHVLDNTLRIYVPTGCVSTYKNDPTWAGIKQFVVGMDEKTGIMEVRGSLVDVRTLEMDKEMYPQKQDILVGGDMVLCGGSAAKYAVGLRRSRGPEQVCATEAGTKPLVAVAATSLSGWTPTGDTFVAGSETYHVFTLNSYTAGTWVDIPQAGNASAIVFGDEVKVVDQPVYGQIIAKVNPLRQHSINNCCIVVLPDGSYLAACTGSEYDNKISMFHSTDKGATWQTRYGNFKTSVNLIDNYPTLFVFQGKVYLMGVGSGRLGIRLCRSDDNGLTWTVADSRNNGIIADEAQTYHTGPGTAIVEHNGRLYAAWEEFVDEDHKNPFMLSCPTNADIMKFDNWTRTNTIVPSPYQYWEGNAVVGPTGQIFNIIRRNAGTSNTAERLLLTSPTTLQDVGTINMPGGGKKFRIVYDPVGKKYWTMTNPHTFEPDAFPVHDGIYQAGLYQSLQRNKLSLICSTDLVNWTVVIDKVFYDEDAFFHGFQYIDFAIDGDDLVAVMRLGAPEERGLPYRQHDANLMSFFKIENFRDL